FGARLPMAAVYHAPTVAQMAALLGDEHQRTGLSRAVEYNRDGSQPRLIWLGGGAIAPALPPTLGSRPPGMSISFAQEELGQLSRSPSLADIASLYLQAIRSAQPGGPYYLGGYCAAGIAAYEAALQLMAEGQDVPLLVMIDAPSPAQWRANIDRSRLRHHVAQMISRRGFARRS